MAPRTVNVADHTWAPTPTLTEADRGETVSPELSTGSIKNVPVETLAMRNRPSDPLTCSDSTNPAALVAVTATPGKAIEHIRDGDVG